MIKRVDIEPTEEELIELIKHDLVGRNEDITDLIFIIDSIDGGYSIFVDGTWGCGKTFFIKQTELVLRTLNKKIDDRKVDNLTEINAFKNFSISKSYLPFYYNAWMYDSNLDPLITLVGNLASGSIKWKDKIGAKKWEIVRTLVDSIFDMIGLRFSLKNIKDAMNDHTLDSLTEEMEIRKKFEKLIDLLLGDNDKLILFIDELDRCSPAFAMKLLERVKFIFGYEKVILIFSTNAYQLANMVKKMYGNDTDGHSYLTRFYDMKLPLRPIDMKQYLSAIRGLGPSATWFSAAVAEAASTLNMRECNRYIQELEAHYDVASEYKGTTSSSGFGRYNEYIIVECVIFPILLSLKTKSETIYFEIIRGEGKDHFLNLMKHSAILKTCIQNYESRSTIKIDLEELYDACFAKKMDYGTFESWELEFNRITARFKSKHKL